MLLLLVSHQIHAAFERDLPSIDVVVEAKGSPMQQMLSGVLYLGAPTGNVPLVVIKALQTHPQVAQIIPISLGNSFRGFRTVGTTPDYITHYQVPLVVGARFLVLNDDSFGLDYRMTDATTVRWPACFRVRSSFVLQTRERAVFNCSLRLVLQPLMCAHSRVMAAGVGLSSILVSLPAQILGQIHGFKHSGPAYSLATGVSKSTKRPG